ncbi:hypothetical protein [Streptomyces malaysiensis]|uniref:hypothetical protein n=1 Tax=Streptomyces malaysiensis TaxID=92644 RepID=UPI00344A9F10
MSLSALSGVADGLGGDGRRYLGDQSPECVDAAADERDVTGSQGVHQVGRVDVLSRAAAGEEPWIAAIGGDVVGPSVLGVFSQDLPERLWNGDRAVFAEGDLYLGSVEVEIVHGQGGNAGEALGEEHEQDGGCTVSQKTASLRIEKLVQKLETIALGEGLVGLLVRMSQPQMRSGPSRARYWICDLLF